MNGIVSVNNKNELENYKLIYPNDKKLKVNISDGLTTARLRLGTTIISSLNFFERLFNCNNLFITKYDYRNFIDAQSSISSRKLSLQFLSNEDKLVQIFYINHIKIVNSQFQEIEVAYISKIKEIYFNDEMKSVIIIIDEKFCSSKERKTLAAKREEENKKRDEEAKKKTLLKEVNDLLN